MPESIMGNKVKEKSGVEALNNNLIERYCYVTTPLSFY